MVHEKTWPRPGIGRDPWGGAGEEASQGRARRGARERAISKEGSPFVSRRGQRTESRSHI